MSYNSLAELFTATADAIRSKTGTIDPIVANDFPEAIRSISGATNVTLNSIKDMNGRYLAYIGIDGKEYSDWKMTLEKGREFKAGDVPLEVNKLLSILPQTIEAWIRVDKDDAVNNRYGIIWGNYQVDTSPYISFEILKNGQPKFELAKAYKDSGEGRVSFVFDNVNVSTGEWLHLAITYDASKGEAYCYVNGELKQTVKKTISMDILKASISSGNSMILGGDQRTGNAQYFKGELAYLAVYSDLRTESEIRQDMIIPGKDNLILYYEADSATGLHIGDLSGNGYHVNICDPSTVIFIWSDNIAMATHCCDVCNIDQTLGCTITEVEGKGHIARATIGGVVFSDAKFNDTLGRGFDASPKLKASKILQTAPVTVEAWINIPKDYNGRPGVIWGNYQPNGNYISFEVLAGGIPKLQRGNEKNIVTGNRDDDEVGKLQFDKVNLCTGKWTHVAITYSGNIGYCYVNGVLAQAVKAVGHYPDQVNVDFNFADYAIGSNYPMVLGGDQRSDNAQYFKGKIASLAVYSDLRTEDEILADMLQPGADNLIAHYELEAGVYRFEDLSGNGYHVGIF